MPRITKKRKPIIDLIQDILDYCTYKNLSKKTLKFYNETLMLFMRYLEEEKSIDDIDKVDKDVVQEYIQFTKDRWKYSFVVSTDGMIKANIDTRIDIGEKISDSTLNNYLRNIKVFFNWMEENQIIKKNTVSRCKFIKTNRKSKEQLSDLEFEKLVQSIDNEYRDFIICNLIMDIGMLLNETLNLIVYNVDFVRGIQHKEQMEY